MRHNSHAMFRHRQGLRRWTTRVLLIWLLGLGIGTVQACLASGRLEAAVAVATLPSVASHLTAAPAGTEGIGLAASPACEHGQPGDDASARSNCADFCDQAGTSMPSLKWPHDALQAAVLFTPIVPFAAPFDLPGLRSLLQARRVASVQAPPIAITLLRLML